MVADGKSTMPHEEKAIKDLIDDLWYKYDKDDSGSIDKEEAKQFIKDNLPNIRSSTGFTDEAFE